MNELMDLQNVAIKNGCANHFGVFAQQRPEALLSINRLFYKYNFTNIIELGTHQGGLSVFLALYCYLSRRQVTVASKGPHSMGPDEEPCISRNSMWHKSPKYFYTFDIYIRDQSIIELLKTLEAGVCLADCDNNPEHIEKIGKLIQGRGQTLVLCDAGDKIKEFENFCPYLKPGDIIMVHDFIYDPDDFESVLQSGEWGACESWHEALRPTMEKYNIVQIHQEEFDDVFWFVGQKQSLTPA